MDVAEVVRPLRRADDNDIALADVPAEARLLERLVDRLRLLLEYDAEAVPGGLRTAKR